MKADKIAFAALALLQGENPIKAYQEIDSIGKDLSTEQIQQKTEQMKTKIRNEKAN